MSSFLVEGSDVKRMEELLVCGCLFLLDKPSFTEPFSIAVPISKIEPE